MLGLYWSVTGLRTGRFASPVRMTGVMFLMSACSTLLLLGRPQPTDEVLWERNSRRFHRKVAVIGTFVLGVTWLAAVAMLRAR